MLELTELEEREQRPAREIGSYRVPEGEYQDQVHTVAKQYLAFVEGLDYRPYFADTVKVVKELLEYQMEITVPEKGEIALTNINESNPESDLPAGIGKPATRALVGAGYLRLEQFTMISEDEVLKLHGVGPKALGLIRQALADKGLSFANRS